MVHLIGSADRGLDVLEETEENFENSDEDNVDV
jgi:hypothetical protein